MNIDNIFKNVKALQNLTYEVDNDLKSICYVEVLGDTKRTLLFPHVLPENIREVGLIVEDMMLYFDGIKFTLYSHHATNICYIEIPDITEEQFFQLSTLNNYNALEYENLDLIRDVYNSAVLED